jgi:glycosyl transferase family 25
MAMQDSFPPIFVINLKRSPERRLSMAERLDPLHVPYSFFEGVDGAHLDLETLPSYAKTRRRLLFGRDLRKGEMGCLLSHRAVYQHMVDHDIDAAVILEDDVFLTPEFPQIIKALARQPVKWDVIRFLEGEKVYKNSRVIGPLCEDYLLTRPLLASGGAYGYMLTKKAAACFLRHMQKNAVPVDTVHSYVWKTGLETFAVKPSPVSPDRVIDSTIGEARFDKTPQIEGWQKAVYPLTRFWLKFSELLGKRRAYWSSLPHDMLLKQRWRQS